jgi:hypothetical protein
MEVWDIYSAGGMIQPLMKTVTPFSAHLTMETPVITMK